MYNGVPQWNQTSWNHTYYHQYMQQHAQLTQWLQQTQQNASTTQHSHCAHHHCCRAPQNSGHNCCGGPQHHCAARNDCCGNRGAPVNMGHAPAVNMHHGAPVNVDHAPAFNMGHPSAVNMGHAPAVNVGHYCPAGDHAIGGYQQQPYADQGYGEELVEESMGLDVEDEYSDLGDEEDDSEGELIFNVDAILEMRATREISDRDSEDSFELLDSVNDDIKEFIELDAFGNVQRVPGKLQSVNVREEELNHKGELRLLYGDKASAIGGVETLMGHQFENLYDIMQPTLWPVLPLRL